MRDIRKKLKKLGPRGRARARGQSLMIVALLLALGVLIGLVALAFDGGSALLQRRTQQNAAEAGVLAGIKLMGQNMLQSCVPAPCHPNYVITNGELASVINDFVNLNQGGTIGPITTTITIEYHFIHDAPECPSPYNNCYRTVTSAGYPPGDYMPSFVDGLRVTSKVNNPTTFARAIANPLSSITVSASSAGRLYPTCPPPPARNETLPFTRFRAALERQMRDPSQGGTGNSICNPYIFWQSQPDVGGPGGNQNFKNTFSLDVTNTWPITVTQAVTQLLSTFDYRFGPPPPAPPDGGLGLYSHNNSGPPYLNCTVATPGNCADLRGRHDPTDLGNWIYWQWRGTIITTSVYPTNTMTRYPANQSTRYGMTATGIRPGDWAEAPYNGNFGQNIQESMHDMAGSSAGIVTPLTTQLNWGKAITRTVYVWGEPEISGTNYIDNQSAQELVQNCNNPNCPASMAWNDLTIDTDNQNRFKANGTIARVRFTHAYIFVFYENLQGTNYGANTQPPGCSASFQLQGSAAYGFLASTFQTGPNRGGCGWAPGNGTYAGQVDPSGP